MNISKTYSLALGGMFLLALTAQSLLLAPQMQDNVFNSLPAWMYDLLGAAFYLLGIFLIASVLLNYSRPAQLWVYLLTTLALASIAWRFFHSNYVAEGAVIGGLAIGFLLCNWLSVKRDWLVEIMQWMNMGIGAGLLIRKDLFLAAPDYILFQPNRLIFSAILLISGLISLIIGLRPSLSNSKAGGFLALPWILWSLMFILPIHLPNLAVALSVGLSVYLSEYIPWEKLVLHQAVDIGRSLFRLLVTGQVASLILVAWVLQLAEINMASHTSQFDQLRQVALISFNGLAVIGILVIASINLSINGLISVLQGHVKTTNGHTHKPLGLWNRFLNSLMEPFTRSQNFLSEHLLVREDYEAVYAKQPVAEKRRVAQLSLVHQLNLELESVLDPPVSAQLTANAIFNSIGGNLTAIFEYDKERDELVALATSGPHLGSIPPSYRQPLSRGIIGRAARLRRTQLASDTRLDPDYFHLENQESLSELAVPLLHNSSLKGVLLVDYDEPHVFDDNDIRTLETVALQLVTSWERSDRDERLTSLIGAGVTLSTTLDVEGVIKEIAEIARQTLDARFVFVALLDKGGGYTRTAFVGYAPTLLGILNSDPGGNTLIQTVFNSATAFRLRDVRKRFTSTPTGSNDLRSLLAVPIRLRQSSIGAILAFGKNGDLSFSENDESLVSLLATQAAAAIETTWLYQELRSMLLTATQLYQLSTKVIQSEQLTDAAAAIAETAYQLSKGDSAGILLITPEKEVEAKVQIDINGLHPGAHHPMDLINQALESGQTIILSGTSQTARICLPLQTPRRQYGALWVQVPEQSWNNSRFTDNLHTLANQAAIALERSLLLVETLKQAEQIEAAYHALEMTYDQTLGALSSALDARDRDTEGHSLRVARIAYHLARRLGLSPEQAKTLERGAILHDIGKIGISDTILLKTGTLSAEEWQNMRLHPDIGARIIEGIPFLQDTLPVIRYHQERWDGSGYPIGLKGNDIPLMARIFAVVDAFDALTNDRPYRKQISQKEAIKFLKQKAGGLFDPAIVVEFEKMVAENELATLV